MLKNIGFMAGATALVLFIVILRTFLFGITALIIGLFFSAPITGFFEQMGFNVTMWQLGLVGGFVSGFFVQPNTQDKK